MMRKNEIDEIVSKAFMVVGGYAFTTMEDGNIRILCLNSPNHASVIRSNGEVLETNMDEVEQDIVALYWQRNKKYMEDKEYAEIL